jgi:hypothetical protein
MIAVLILAAHELQDEPSRGRLGLNLSGGAIVAPAPTAQLNGDLEGLWLPAPYLRLGLSAGGFWQQAQTGGTRFLGVVEAAIPQWWGEWFAGLAGGVAYANVLPGGDWKWLAAARGRFGADLVLFRPLCVGVAISYALLTPPFVQGVSIDLRAGLAF